jgi:AcrR family transcriptional regulator
MPQSETRVYSSPLRQRQQESTRQLIMEALADLIAEGRLHTLSVQDVADRAGISYASVYRHFPSREKLFEGLYEWGSERVRSQMPPTPRTLDDVPEWVRKSVAVAYRHAAVNQAVTAILTALDINPDSRRRRDLEVQKLVAVSAPNMSPRLKRQSSAVIRYLAGSQAWATLGQRFGLDAEDTAAALGWVLEAFIRDLKQRAPGPGRAHKCAKEKAES